MILRRLLVLAAVALLLRSLPGTAQTTAPIWVYNNWSAYDELSDNVPLTEELAMRELEAAGPGGHSALPTGENAISRLAGALVRLDGLVFPISLDGISVLYTQNAGVADAFNASATPDRFPSTNIEARSG